MLPSQETENSSWKSRAEEVVRWCYSLDKIDAIFQELPNEPCNDARTTKIAMAGELERRLFALIDEFTGANPQVTSMNQQRRAFSCVQRVFCKVEAFKFEEQLSSGHQQVGGGGGGAVAAAASVKKEPSTATPDVQYSSSSSRDTRGKKTAVPENVASARVVPYIPNSSNVIDLLDDDDANANDSGIKHEMDEADQDGKKSTKDLSGKVDGSRTGVLSTNEPNGKDDGKLLTMGNDGDVEQSEDEASDTEKSPSHGTTTVAAKTMASQPSRKGDMGTRIASSALSSRDSSTAGKAVTQGTEARLPLPSSQSRQLMAMTKSPRKSTSSNQTSSFDRASRTTKETQSDGSSNDQHQLQKRKVSDEASKTSSRHNKKQCTISSGQDVVAGRDDEAATRGGPALTVREKIVAARPPRIHKLTFVDEATWQVTAEEIAVHVNSIIDNDCYKKDIANAAAKYEATGIWPNPWFHTLHNAGSKMKRMYDSIPLGIDTCSGKAIVKIRLAWQEWKKRKIALKIFYMENKSTGQCSVQVQFRHGEQISVSKLASKEPAMAAHYLLREWLDALGSETKNKLSKVDTDYMKHEVREEVMSVYK